ncbi:recombinase family protein [Hyphococcus sp.]|uniref:recombinase family protein n=1 Tax=Hyphococcus sp. TaxID=2038636 RepID=UPI0020884B28|nr:MAG: hypothetical protein DHS20C04_27300 [Marinicaulis sp.]
MKIAYTAKIKGAATVDEQREALTEIGAGKLIEEGAPARRVKPGEDPRPARSRAVRILRPGDELCVYSATHLARDMGDLFTVLAAITAQAATLYVIDMAKSFTATPDHAALARAFTGDKRKAQTEAARAAPKKKRGGRPKAIDLKGADLAEFKRMWKDPDIDRKAIGRRFKASVATIVRRASDLDLGPKA